MLKQKKNSSSDLANNATSLTQIQSGQLKNINYLKKELSKIDKNFYQKLNTLEKEYLKQKQIFDQNYDHYIAALYDYLNSAVSTFIPQEKQLLEKKKRFTAETYQKDQNWQDVYCHNIKNIEIHLSSLINTLEKIKKCIEQFLDSHREQYPLDKLEQILFTFK